MSQRTKYSNCLVCINKLILTSEQQLRREYYEEIFKDVLDVIRTHDKAALDLTELETRRREVFIIDASAGLRKKLRKTFGESVTERLHRSNGSSLCKLLGFSL